MTLLSFLTLFYDTFKLETYPSIQITSNYKKNLIIFKGTYGFFIINTHSILKTFMPHNIKYKALFLNYLKTQIYSLEYTYKQVILCKGVGFKFDIRKTKNTKQTYLKLKAGYNKPILFKFDNSYFKLKSPKVTRLSIQSLEKHKLSLFIKFIRMFRVPDAYKGKGLYTRYLKVVRKEVRKSK